MRQEGAERGPAGSAGFSRDAEAVRQSNLSAKLWRLILHVNTDEATREVARRKLALLSGAEPERPEAALEALEGRGRAQGGLLAIGARGRHFRHWAAAPESQVLDVLA